MCIMNEPPPSLKRSPHASSSAARPLKVRRIMSSLPQRLRQVTADTSENDVLSNIDKDVPVSPQEHLVSLVESKGETVRISSALALQGYFSPPTEDEINAYSHDVLHAIRTRDVEKLREFHNSGRPLKCSNKFGESLLHLACRRGFDDVVEFLVKKAGVTVRVIDDYGRTPLHDAFWTCEPNMDLIELLITQCPSLLYMKDRRGNTPLEYARREQWEAYNKFLTERQDLLLIDKD